MKKLKFKSLTMRIWMTFTAIILVIVCSISIFYVSAFRQYDESEKKQILKASHEMAKDKSFTPPSQFSEMKNLKDVRNFFVVIDEDNSIQLANPDKRPIPPESDIQSGKHSGFQDDTELRLWMASYIKDNKTINEQQFKETKNGNKYIFIISSITSDSGGRNYLISYIPNNNDNTVLYLMMGIGLVFIVIGFFTAKIVASRISKPLKELERFTMRIAQKDWKDPIVIKSEDEIGRLANAMNQMQTELKRADEEEKMFLQSISHDLKTPVMVIMSHADAIIDGVYIDSVEQTAEIIRDEAICLEKKIKQMLYLNTLDYVLENNVENSEIYLNDLLLHIINRFEVVKSSIEWDLDMDEVVINGNIDKIQVALENILENGLRYAKSRISVKVKKEEDRAILELYNDGPNIPEKHINRIFDNMYKDKTGNFGLGLAITKKIIDFYNGKIKAVNREDGVSFIIEFPL